MLNQLNACIDACFIMNALHWHTLLISSSTKNYILVTTAIIVNVKIVEPAASQTIKKHVNFIICWTDGTNGQSKHKEQNKLTFENFAVLYTTGR